MFEFPQNRVPVATDPDGVLGPIAVIGWSSSNWLQDNPRNNPSDRWIRDPNSRGYVITPGSHAKLLKLHHWPKRLA